VAFQSQATDLVSNDYNNRWDVFNSCGWGHDTRVDFTMPLPSEFRVNLNAFRPATDPMVAVYILCRTPGKLRVNIYNSAGELVKHLVPETVNSGEWVHEATWDGLNDDRQKVASGVYLIHYEDPATALTRMLAVIR